jgi:hypothetical protein
MPGYTTDYSINEFSVDREGPADEPAAIDWTFPDAQGGDYLTISKYSKRLLAAGKAGRACGPAHPVHAGVLRQHRLRP